MEHSFFLLLFEPNEVHQTIVISSAKTKKNWYLYLGRFCVCLQLSQLNYEYVDFLFRNTELYTFMQRMSLFIYPGFLLMFFKQCFVWCARYVLFGECHIFLQNQNTTHLNKQAWFSVNKQCKMVQCAVRKSKIWQLFLSFHKNRFWFTRNHHPHDAIFSPLVYLILFNSWKLLSTSYM